MNDCDNCIVCVSVEHQLSRIHWIPTIMMWFNCIVVARSLWALSCDNNHPYKVPFDVRVVRL